MGDDPLDAAKGIVGGIILGLMLWLIILAVFCL